MGSPLGPTLANAFLCHYKKECPSHVKPIVYQRYVDDIFVRFSSKEYLQSFIGYMNKQQKYIKFTSKTEQNNTFSFLDINTTHQNNKFKTSVYRKPIFSDVFTHYESYIDKTCKESFIFTLLSRCYCIRLEYTVFHPFGSWKTKRNFKKEQLPVRYYRSVNKNF